MAATVIAGLTINYLYGLWGEQSVPSGQRLSRAAARLVCERAQGRAAGGVRFGRGGHRQDRLHAGLSRFPAEKRRGAHRAEAVRRAIRCGRALYADARGADATRPGREESTPAGVAAPVGPG